MISKRDLNSLSRKRNQPVKRAASIKPKPAQPVSPQEPEDPDYVPFGVKGVLGATERLLAVSRGLDEPDNRDSYGFKRIWGVDKHLGERIRLDAGKIRRQQIRTAAKLRSLKGTHPFAFDTYTRGLILGDPGEANPLSSPLEEINPLHLLEQARRITQMGPGGIQSSQAITADGQNVSASQFGFVSSIAGPESEKIGIDARLAHGVRIGSDGQLYQQFKNSRTKQLEWKTPGEIEHLTVRIPD
jgi:DNA-directed RNA polymerase beta subunit